MTSDREKVRLIFGLKIKQLRGELGLSTYDLADKTGLSPSYLNEIEKGKKYPKTEKVFALAKALNSTYDTLVSLQVNKALEPVVELLNSNILNELPLDLFGIEPTYFLEVMANAPAKLSAFINTLIEIGRNYDLSVEQFYFSVLRTYQAMHHNYFEELEAQADAFLTDNPLPQLPEQRTDWLISILNQTYQCTVEFYDETTQPALLSLRSVYLPEQSKLLVNNKLSTEQRVFTLAREVGYHRLNQTVRPLESSVLEARSFDEVLHNFQASYFARCILIPRSRLLDELRTLVQQPNWSNDRMLGMLAEAAVTPEMFLLRVTNLLSGYFELNDLFFLRFNQLASGRFLLAKELHLSKLHTPHGVARDEHYCRRQVSVTILNELRQLQQSGQWDGQPICRAQRISFATNDTTYFVFSIAKSSPPTTDNSSVNIGFPITDTLLERLPFIGDPSLPTTPVGETCERCPIADCTVRAAPPTELNQQQRTAHIQQTIAQLRAGNQPA
ncbi:helix-turn-helix domain-containing protein [Spirosoma rhododendri]|uniref:Helix-turn-helix domain-containing protein n=1 Tax=Spirosoma rhododendri TaxID=2728024 RepID=A0A7L5DQG5_9BACT|nr:XRE family transcriptional regulator [Spirosoma rhododendri]QJD80704.1 helix-turn-helix domain-containing protein [Spirosoma rhododendri]